MNTDIAISDETPAVHTLDFSPNPKTRHRKIGKLPKPLRDLINTSLDDGLPARQIIEKLQASTNPPLPYPISEVNISDWRKTGYQHYLNQEERLALIQSNHEAARDMLAANDTMTLPEAGLQIIASQYFEFLADFSPAALKEKLVEDPLKYTRFLNVFARLVREIVHMRKYRDAIVKASAESQSTDSDHRALVDQFDAFMRAPHPLTPTLTPTPTPTSSPSSTPAPSNCPPGPSGPSGLSLAPIPSTPESQPVTSASAPIENQNSKIPNSAPPLPQATTADVLGERCLDCQSPLPIAPPNAKRRPEDHCQNCGMRLPDIGLCIQPGSDHCLNCGATQPALLPNRQRSRTHCHNCGDRLHNPELPT